MITTRIEDVFGKADENYLGASIINRDGVLADLTSDEIGKLRKGPCRLRIGCVQYVNSKENVTGRQVLADLFNPEGNDDLKIGADASNRKLSISRPVEFKLD